MRQGGVKALLLLSKSTYNQPNYTLATSANKSLIKGAGPLRVVAIFMRLFDQYEFYLVAFDCMCHLLASAILLFYFF